jgi:hypothetical protein
VLHVRCAKCKAARQAFDLELALWPRSHPSAQVSIARNEESLVKHIRVYLSLTVRAVVDERRPVRRFHRVTNGFGSLGFF